MSVCILQGENARLSRVGPGGFSITAISAATVYGIVRIDV